MVVRASAPKKKNHNITIRGRFICASGTHSLPTGNNCWLVPPVRNICMYSYPYPCWPELINPIGCEFIVIVQCAMASSSSSLSHPECRAITESRCSVALAMLRGYKPFVSHSGVFPVGWYWLHVGAQDNCRQVGILKERCASALTQSWPSAPIDEDLPKSCILGRIYLGRVLPAES